MYAKRLLTVGMFFLLVLVSRPESVTAQTTSPFKLSATKSEVFQN